jgi:hypothetical protein
VVTRLKSASLRPILLTALFLEAMAALPMRRLVLSLAFVYQTIAALEVMLAHAPGIFWFHWQVGHL